MLDWVCGPGFHEFFGRNEFIDFFPFNSAQEFRQRHLRGIR
jgi:hypothetical protein